MKLKKFKERDNKKLGVILFTLICLFLISGAVLYRTFAIFEVKTNQNVIKGTVQDPGNIYFAFYVDEKIQKDMPQINSGYILDEDASYCGISGQEDENIHVSLTEDYTVHVSGMTSSRTKCNLYFVKGTFILGKPVKAVTSGDGLYEVKHEDSVLDEGFLRTEWRYAGKDPNNYIMFNEEKWRMIGSVNVIIDDNIVEQRVKIIRGESLGKYVWDNNNNKWATSSIKDFLNNGNYYNRTNEFSETGLKDTAKGQINKVIWNVGMCVNKTLISELYDCDHGSELWEGDVAFISMSDFYQALSDRKSDVILEVGNDNLIKNWLFISYDYMLLNYRVNDNNTFTINTVSQSNGMTSGHPPEMNMGVIPSVYLKTNVKIINDGQDGSVEHPYNLKIE